MKKNSLVTLATYLVGILFVTNVAFGQRVVTGKVVDNDTKKPLKEAKVKIAGTLTEVSVNVLGFFQLTLDTATHLIVESAGYETAQVKVPDVNTFQIALVKHVSHMETPSQPKALSEPDPLSESGPFSEPDPISKQEPQPKTVSNAEVVHTFVEQQPEFPGGMAAMQKYFNRNLHYPGDANRKGIQGRVFVSFVIDTTGAIMPDRIKIIKGLSPSCDTEARRLITQFPNWLPGRQNGMAVRVLYTLPVNFGPDR